MVYHQLAAVLGKEFPDGEGQPSASYVESLGNPLLDPQPHRLLQDDRVPLCNARLGREGVDGLNRTQRLLDNGVGFVDTLCCTKLDASTLRLEETKRASELLSSCLFFLKF
ncbi:hypothetical protein ZIOFF_013902 [Zingiber officinale]|uniref:Uncharacterized protein n=1 Tax=Zingiber officinale TaxID=94328 RepID=A0A8J5HV73_ZINOF|nr:hypothetical protein ZIOFF_013902 [Zingiber officinale]